MIRYAFGLKGLLASKFGRAEGLSQKDGLKLGSETVQEGLGRSKSESRTESERQPENWV